MSVFERNSKERHNDRQRSRRKWGVTKRRAQEIIREGKIAEKYRKQMYIIGKAWVMPADTPKPPDLRKMRAKGGK